MNRMRFAIFAMVCATPLLVQTSLAQESFQVELGKDGETIEDMRPVFLTFEARPLPAISPTEVARRYQRLFDASDEPEVRIDALNRLSNIQDVSGEDVGFSADQEARVYQQALESYESILTRGSYSGKLDELLYQMARAHALTGESEKSIDRLEQLVGLYPDSSLVPEAHFRIAESEFASGEYFQAEAAYLAAIKAAENPELTRKARYMLGWSQFKQGESAWSRAGKTFYTVLDSLLPDPQSVNALSDTEVDLIDDALRIVATMAARQGGTDTLVQWLGDGNERAWTYLAFDRLADYYAANGAFEQSVQTNRAFVDFSPEHAAKPLFMVQIADVWRMVGDAAKVRRAHADYVAMFATDKAFIQLPPEEQQRWRSVSRELADYYYHAGSGLKEQAGARAESAFATAAGYYRALGDRQDRPGEVLRLAGDAYLQAGDIQNALQSFQQAAYDTADYGEAADSGWAAITVLRQQWLEGGGAATDRLTGLTSEADRFADKFPEDSRVSGLMADLAGKWLEAGDREQALKYAQTVLTNPRATPSTRYSAWVVTGRGRQQLGEFGLAERAWKHALDLTADPAVPDEIAGTDDTVRSQLATAIYRQGENAAAAGNAAAAVAHFRRVGPVVPGSDIAIKAQFDAGNTLLKAGEYALAIPELEAFRRDYPSNPLASEISEKLVHAYVSSDQPAAAAQELLDRAKNSPDPWPLKLRAAGLFHEAGSIPRRNQVYAAYLDTQPTATSAAEHIELQTLRHRLLSTVEAPDPYRQALLSQEMDSRWHSDQTLAWAARQSLILGAKAAASFATIRLGQPLAESLSAKQVALERARKYFLDAEALAGDAVLSESLYRRAELYRALATDLMNSTVPGELNELEAMQYQMLLEEEAFPFEEKAIRLHADNHRRITSSGYDAWIGKSLDVLAALNPGRYERSVRWMSWANDEEGDDAG